MYFFIVFFFHFPARLDFPSPPIYAPGSPRMWLIVLSCKTILDVQATISLTNDRFDGNRHRPLYPYRGSNVYVSLCHDEVLHYLSFPVLCAQGLSLHCRTLLKFMNVPTRREHTKVQESAPFASEPVLFVSGNTLSVNIGYVCWSLSHPTKKYFLPLSCFWDGRDQGTSFHSSKGGSDAHQFYWKQGLGGGAQSHGLKNLLLSYGF